MPCLHQNIDKKNKNQSKNKEVTLAGFIAQSKV